MFFLFKSTNHVIMLHLKLVEIYYFVIFAVVHLPVSYALCSVSTLFWGKALDFST